MVKVITYGTFDLLHEGHIRLLQRARALGDRLIVGVTADGFDLSRGKINVQQSLMERIENVRSTGLADEILIEEYEGQKIDDIQRLGIDIFTVGSDWEGEFDYLSAYCRVIYLPRTEGVSSSQLRASRREVAIGLVGENAILNKFAAESGYVNGVRISGICARDRGRLSPQLKALPAMELPELLDASDAVYIASHPSQHVEHVRAALEAGRHVLCEAPLAPSGPECEELFKLAQSRGLILTEGNKTAYSTAYARLLLLVKSGKIGRVVSVDATCTSLRPEADQPLSWSSLAAFGPAALLPVVQLLGHEYTDCRAVSLTARPGYDLFTRLDVRYPGAVATVKVGKGVKSEGELIITGTEGYAWVPAPWWKTDYFELRYENPADNRRYFYQLDGEGLRCQIVAFLRAIETGKPPAQLPGQLTRTLCTLLSTPAEEL